MWKKNHGPFSRDRVVNANSFSGGSMSCGDAPFATALSNFATPPERAMNSLTPQKGSEQSGGQDAVATGGVGVGQHDRRRTGLAEAVDHQVGAGQVVVGG